MANKALVPVEDKGDEVVLTDVGLMRKVFYALLATSFDDIPHSQRIRAVRNAAREYGRPLSLKECRRLVLFIEIASGAK